MGKRCRFRDRVVLHRQTLNLDNFTATMRHSDWADWEVGEKLRLGRKWVRVLLRSPEATRFSEFCLELETVEWNVDQLRRSRRGCAQRAKRRKVKMRDGSLLNRSKKRHGLDQATSVDMSIPCTRIATDWTIMSLQ